MAKRDYYKVLGCDKAADEKVLKSAYRKLAMQHHPDKNPNDAGAEARFKEVNEAYSILSDGDKRAAYDRMGHAAFEGGAGGAQGAQGFGDFNDIFSQIFGGGAGASGFSDMFGGAQGGRGRQARRSVRGADLRYEVNVRLKEAFHGKELEINVPISDDCAACNGVGAAPGAKVETCGQCHGAGKIRTQQGFFSMERPCPKCGGQGEYVSDPCRRCDGRGLARKNTKLKVSIPAGVEDGTRIRLSGQGDNAPKGAGPNRQRGDLYLFVSVETHELFKREESNLFCRVPVPMSVAILGGEIEIPTIDGGRAKIKIPEGSQTGRRMRLKGKGMSILRHTECGDMYVELQVETPTRLNAKQKELLKAFRAAGGDQECSPQSHSFLDKIKKIWEDLI